MTYITCSNTPGNLDDFRKVNERLRDKADGLVALYGGASDLGLAITVVWESKAQADRFMAEHLMPTLRDVVGEDVVGQPGVRIAFEAAEVLIPARSK